MITITTQEIDMDYVEICKELLLDNDKATPLIHDLSRIYVAVIQSPLLRESCGVCFAAMDRRNPEPTINLYSILFLMGVRYAMQQQQDSFITRELERSFNVDPPTHYDPVPDGEK